ncbi:hypothetical protein WA158_003576 [Blastocystis sp. Blastoise]
MSYQNTIFELINQARGEFSFKRYDNCILAYNSALKFADSILPVLSDSEKDELEKMRNECMNERDYVLKNMNEKILESYPSVLPSSVFVSSEKDNHSELNQPSPSTHQSSESIHSSESNGNQEKPNDDLEKNIKSAISSFQGFLSNAAEKTIEMINETSKQYQQKKQNETTTTSSPPNNVDSNNTTNVNNNNNNNNSDTMNDTKDKESKIIDAQTAFSNYLKQISEVDNKYQLTENTCKLAASAFHASADFFSESLKFISNEIDKNVEKKKNNLNSSENNQETDEKESQSPKDTHPIYSSPLEYPQQQSTTQNNSSPSTFNNSTTPCPQSNPDSMPNTYNNEK